MSDRANLANLLIDALGLRGRQAIQKIVIEFAVNTPVTVYIKEQLVSADRLAAIADCFQVVQAAHSEAFARTPVADVQVQENDEVLVYYTTAEKKETENG